MEVFSAPLHLFRFRNMFILCALLTEMIYCMQLREHAECCWRGSRIDDMSGHVGR